MDHRFTNQQRTDLRNNYNFTFDELQRLEILDFEIEDIYNDVRHVLNAYDHDSMNHGILTNLLEQGYTFEEIEDLIERGLMDEDFERLLGITSFEPNDLYTHITQLFDTGDTIEEVRQFIINHQDDDNDVLDIEGIVLGAPEQGGKRRRKSRKQCKTRSRKQCKTRRRKQRKSRKH